MPTNPHPNKIIYGDQVLIDLTSDTVTRNDVRVGKTFHLPTGEQTTGTFPGSWATGDAVTVTPSINAFVVMPADEGVDCFTEVDVNAIPYDETDNLAGGVTVEIGDNVTPPAPIANKLLSDVTGDLFSVTASDLDGATTIRSYAFYLSNLTSIEVPDSVTTIGSNAFGQCNNLTSVIIPFIGYSKYSSKYFKYLFGATSYSDTDNDHQPPSTLTSVVISDAGLTSVDAYAFYTCSNIRTITLPSTITSIGNAAFNQCSSLASINIPSGVTSIGSGAFYYCTSLTSVTLPAEITTILSSTFCNCTALTSINIPSGVVSIGSIAFSSCTSLTSVIIPDTVRTIYSSAFSLCEGLKTLTLGSSVTDIYSNGFGGCYALETIISRNSTPPYLDTGAFSQVSSSIPVYVPAASVSTYQSASGWSNFTNIQAIPS